jgi:hypothetical protein
MGVPALSVTPAMTAPIARSHGAVGRHLSGGLDVACGAVIGDWLV